MTHIYAHGHLVLHHLHKLSKRRIFRGLYQVILPGRILSIVVPVPIVYHVGDQADFQQVPILRHLAEFESELLLGRIVEVGAEKRGIVDSCMRIGGRGAIWLPRCRFLTLDCDLIGV